MSKPIILAVGGVVVGVIVAFGVFTLLLGGGGDEAAAASLPTEPVNVSGKLGPHVVLSDRVFNLLPEAGREPVYLKLQTVIEFETLDPQWEYVLNGCGSKDHGSRLVPPGHLGTGDLMVSAVPGGVVVRATDETASGETADPCEEERHALMAEFDHEIGTGISVIEDVVTTIVTGHTVSEIETPEGKEVLKAEIKKAVDGLIGEPHVHRVLFLNFITQ